MVGPEHEVIRVLPAGTMEEVPIEAHLDAAAAAGFDAVSLRPRHVRTWLAAAPGRTVEGLAGRVRERALGVAELDPVTGWSDPRSWSTSDLPAAVLDELDLAAALGSRAVSALVLPAERWEPGVGIEGLGRLGAAADERDLLVQLEPFGWSPLWDLGAAAAAAEAAGAANVGVLVDTWHLDRRGGGAATVAALPIEAVLAVQICDGAALVPGVELSVDNRDGRRFPGESEGVLRPELVLAGLLDRGWLGPVAIEVFGDASSDPPGRAERAARSLRAVMSGATTGRTTDG